MPHNVAKPEIGRSTDVDANDVDVVNATVYTPSDYESDTRPADDEEESSEDTFLYPDPYIQSIDYSRDVIHFQVVATWCHVQHMLAENKVVLPHTGALY